MTTWRLADLVVDAVRNVAGSPLRTVLLAVTAAGLIGGLVYAELATTGDLLAFQERFIGGGGNVVVASNDGGLDAARCAALAARSGVVGSAATQSGPPVTVDRAPGTLFQTGTVTVGALTLFASGDPPSVAAVAARWIVGDAAADELGLAPGAWLGIGADAPRRVGAVIDTEQRNPQIARWILTIAPPAGVASQCFVEYAPGAVAGRREVLETVFAASGEQLVVRPWIRPDEFTRDPVAELKVRPQAAAWLLGGLLLAGIGWLATWFRRADIGLYRAAGTSRSALLVLGAVEHALTLIIGGAAGGLWGAAVWAAIAGDYPDPDQIKIAARTAASTMLLALAAAPLLWPITARDSMAQQLKER